MNIRQFTPKDAEFCFKVRSNALIKKFYDELGPEAVVAGINAYMPNDFVRMSKEMEFFLLEEKELSIGFFTIKRIDATTAEIPLIYIDLDYLGKGIGKACIQFIEKWLSSNWKDVVMLIVDTIIPEYNSGFYKKVGFLPVEETYCYFPDLRVKALRLCKMLNS